ncbi:hypothetical protein SH449x_002732 [Pirellulaceae bacterium SH449]
MELPIASGRFEANVAEPLPDEEYRCDILLDGQVEFFGRLYPRFSREIGDNLSLTSGPDVQRVEFQFVVNEAPISGVTIRIAGRTLFSDTNGVARVWLTPGLYTARFIPPTGFETISEIDIPVDTEDVQLELELTPISIDLLPTPETCVVTIYVADQFGTPLANVPLLAKLPKGYAVVQDTLNINTITASTTDSNGLATLLLLRNQLYDLQVRRPSEGMVTIRISVPNAPTASLSQVVEV